METIVVEYLAEKVWEDIRNGRPLDPELARAINKMGVIEHIRTMVRETDEEILKNLILNSNHYAIVRIGIILLQPLQETVPTLRDFLIAVWNSPSWRSDEWEFNIKVELMFRLLDYPDLENTIHISIYNYIEQNCAKWMQECLSYFDLAGNWDNLIPIMQKKLEDDRFPRSKDWIYLTMLSSYPKKDKIMPIISRYLNSEFKMVKRIANGLLESPCAKLHGIII